MEPLRPQPERSELCPAGRDPRGTATDQSHDRILAAADLCVGHGHNAVLSQVTLTVRSGELLALVGSNGSGKTTLLRVLAGLDRPLAGRIHWAQGPLPTGAERTRALGILFQGEVPAPFTVRELVCLGLGLDGPPSAEHHRQVDAALARMHLSELADRLCTHLSGGEWQRALLGRALVAAPQVLVLDEPTNHLDPARRAQLFALLQELRGSVAVIVATHDLDCAALCDRIAVLAAGSLFAVGSPAQVLVPAVLAHALGVEVRCVADPAGGPPLIRLLGPAHVNQTGHQAGKRPDSQADSQAGNQADSQAGNQAGQCS